MTDCEKEQAIYSARYILEEFFEDGRNGITVLALATGYPEGVIHAALENIFCAEIK